MVCLETIFRVFQPLLLARCLLSWNATGGADIVSAARSQERRHTVSRQGARPVGAAPKGLVGVRVHLQKLAKKSLVIFATGCVYFQQG